MASLVKVVLTGAGSHAVSVVDLVESVGSSSIVGVLDDRMPQGKHFLTYACLGDFDSLANWVNRENHFVVSVGQIGGPGIRQSLFENLLRVQAKILTVVSRHAYVSPRSSLGAGTAVFHGVVINAGASVGDNCIINSLSLVEHDATVGSHSHIATGARVNGGATIGSRCFIGSGAVIFQGCQIPDDAVVPAGAVVKRWPLGS